MSITRESDQVPGTASRLANDEMLEVRAFMNEGGKLLFTGKNAGVQYQDAYLFDPVANEPCDPRRRTDTRCQLLSSDFLQYYLGAYLFNEGAGLIDPAAEPGAVTRPRPQRPVRVPRLGAQRRRRCRQPEDSANSFLTTSSLLPPDEFPQFASEAPAEWDDGVAGAFEPFDGSKYMYSNRANGSYKRLSRTIDVPAGGATLTFQTSYDLEVDFDYMFVEAHTVGEDDWTTLPDANGATDPEPGEDPTGISCSDGWIEDLHPFLAHYQTLNDDGTCSPTGTEGSPPGEWNAATGRSGGWQPWEIDLSDYAGEQVELAITVASDPGVQNVNAFVDDIDVSTGEGTTSFEDDADPFDGWQVPGAPEGTNTNPNDWERTGSLGFDEGAVVSTDDSLFFGFGFEGISTAAQRNEVLGRSMNYLLGSP